VDKRTEHRLLSALEAAGWIGESEVEQDSTRETPPQLNKRWGTRLADLINCGLLDEDWLIEFLAGLTMEPITTGQQPETETTITCDVSSSPGTGGCSAFGRKGY